MHNNNNNQNLPVFWVFTLVYINKTSKLERDHTNQTRLCHKVSRLWLVVVKT